MFQTSDTQNREKAWPGNNDRDGNDDHDGQADHEDGDKSEKDAAPPPCSGKLRRSSQRANATERTHERDPPDTCTWDRNPSEKSELNGGFRKYLEGGSKN